MRARLIAAARRLFVSQGYAATSTPAIVVEAGVTRGALYHHFPDKRAIFHAVVEAESTQVANAIEAAESPGMTALERLFSGAEAYIRAMQADGRTRLLLVDGPAVLGRDSVHQIESQNGDANLKIGLEEAMADGALKRLPIAPLVSLLSAVFERAALDVANGQAPADILDVLWQILGGLITSDAQPGFRKWENGRPSG
jgi:AcrR family transcriptional regulator